MKIFIILTLTFIVSCGTLVKGTRDYSRLGEPVNEDYIDHLASAGGDYLSHVDVREINLNKGSIQFLNGIYERIVSSNELLMLQHPNPSFHVIINKTPFVFSLPKSQFFISNGLIEKYLKSEELFVAALAAEILKSSRNIYEKKIMIPLGFYNSEKMILLTRLRTETKYQVNEWTYFVLKRSGFDASAYLNWIQVQNRNTLDFSLFLGDTLGISKEEHLFKNFMAKQGVASVEKKINEANSSKEFYKLLNNIASNK